MSSSHFSEKSLGICDVETVYGELSIYKMIVPIYSVPIRFQTLCLMHYVCVYIYIYNIIYMYRYILYVYNGILFSLKT